MYWRCDYLFVVEILVVLFRGILVLFEIVSIIVFRCWNMVSFCSYVRIFDRLWFCIIGIWDIVLLFGNVVCDVIVKLLFWIIVIVFVVVGRGIVIFVCFWFCMFVFVEIVVLDVCVVLLGVCEVSWLVVAVVIVIWCWLGM